jgi:hypothetical protein
MHKAIVLPVVCVVCYLEYGGKYRIYLKTVFLGKKLYPREDGYLNNEELQNFVILTFSEIFEFHLYTS